MWKKLFEPLYSARAVARAVGLVFLAAALVAFAAGAWSGHDKGEASYNVNVACNNPASAVGVVQASSRGVAGAFFMSQVRQGLCKLFKPEPLRFWFDRIVIDDLVWSDGDVMVIIQGHDRAGFVIFTWGTAEVARANGWLTPLPPPSK